MIRLGAFAAPGQVLPLFFTSMVGPRMASTCAFSVPRAPAGPGPLGAGLLGSALVSSNFGLGFGSAWRLPPPSSCLLTQPAGMGGTGWTRGAQAWTHLASQMEARVVPLWETSSGK